MFGFSKGAKRISPKDAKERMDQDKSIVLIDVRTPQEYRQGHIPKSKSVPLDTLERDITKVAPNKDTELIVYCLSGGRASSACNILSSMGYTNLSNLGGIQAWPYGIIK